MEDDQQLPTPSPSFSSFNHLHHHHHKSVTRPSSPRNLAHHHHQHAPTTPTPLRRSTTPTVPSATNPQPNHPPQTPPPLPPLNLDSSGLKHRTQTRVPQPTSPLSSTSPRSKARPSPLLRLLSPFTNAYYSHSAPTSPTTVSSITATIPSPTKANIKYTSSVESVPSMPILHHPTPHAYYESAPLSPANLQMHQQQQQQQHHQRPASRSERMLRDALIRDEKERQATGKRRNSRAGTQGTGASASASVSSRGSGSREERREDEQRERERELQREREREETYRGVFLFRTALSNPHVPRSASASPSPSPRSLRGEGEASSKGYWTGDAEAEEDVYGPTGATKARPRSPALSRSSAASMASRRAVGGDISAYAPSASQASHSPVRKRQLLDQERIDNTPTPTPTRDHRPEMLDLGRDESVGLGRSHTISGTPRKSGFGEERERKRRSLQATQGAEAAALKSGQPMTPHERHLREKLERMLGQGEGNAESESSGSKRSRSGEDDGDEISDRVFDISCSPPAMPISSESTTVHNATSSTSTSTTPSTTASTADFSGAAPATDAAETPSTFTTTSILMNTMKRFRRIMTTSPTTMTTSPLAHQKPFQPAHRRSSQSVSAIPQTPSKTTSPTALRGQSPSVYRSQSPSALRSQSPSTPLRARDRGYSQSPSTPTGHRVRSKTEPATNFATSGSPKVLRSGAAPGRTPTTAATRNTAASPSPRRMTTAPAGQGITQRRVTHKVIGTGTTPPLEPDVGAGGHGILGGPVAAATQQKKTTADDDDEDPSLLTPPPTPPFTARMVADIGTGVGVDGYCPSPYKASFEGDIGGSGGVKKKLFGFAGRYGNLGGLGAPSGGVVRGGGGGDLEGDDDETSLSRDDLSLAGREMMESEAGDDGDEPPLSPVARLEERLFESSQGYGVDGYHKRSQSNPGPMGGATTATSGATTATSGATATSSRMRRSHESMAGSTSGLGANTFNARKASAHCWQIE
ncbi:hypothetical protein CVT24_004649, partial [Panaeolus cyanescens]